MCFCEKCGSRLTRKVCGPDGLIPYCETCREFRFPTYSSAISVLLYNPNRDKILLIQQYGRSDNILIAGYINKGENAKQTLVREVEEEVGLHVTDYVYNDNEYFEKTNTLMHNYAAAADSENFTLTGEVDRALWVPEVQVLDAMKPGSLARSFAERYLKKKQERRSGGSGPDPVL